MQDVFEKIIDRIKKVEDGRCPNYECWKYLNKDCGECFEIEIKIKDAIEIVKQVAAEYDGGWIPCSERMPENISTVIVQVKEIEKPTFGWYGNKTGWRLAEKDFVELKDFTVIAWQPLPEPYLRMESEKCETAGY